MDKRTAIKEHIKTFGKAAVAYSGGFDSTLLLKIASDALNKDCVGIFVDSPLISQRQRDSAYNIAESLGLDVKTVRIEWEDMPGVLENTEERCYNCKLAIYGAVIKKASEFDIVTIMDGENYDDHTEHRPGRKAASELDVLSPLFDLEITREDVIDMIGTMNIPVPMIKDTCMATRIHSGTPFCESDLRTVEECESLIRKLSNVKQIRMRIDGKNATLLTSPEEIPLLEQMYDELSKELEQRGFIITVDKNGYKK